MVPARMTEHSAAVPPSQYRDSRNLAARARLPLRYSNVSWFAWVADRLALPEGAAVLDVGCGPGWFWAAPSARLPSTVRLTLTDLSYGMVQEARRRVLDAGRFAWIDGCQADAASLPFADAQFDAVVAMHMLYHLAEPHRAVAEMARVVRPRGRLFVTTNGSGDMVALNRLRAAAFGGDAIDPGAAHFGLEQAEKVLRARFAEVERDVLSDVYRVTDPNDISAYLMSMPPAIDASTEQRVALQRRIDEAFAAGGGVLELNRESGLVTATVP